MIYKLNNNNCLFYQQKQFVFLLIVMIVVKQEMPSTLTQEWLPVAASTPVSTSSITIGSRRSERDIENELFQNIETAVQEFLRHSNREYPSYRIIRCTIGEQPRLEYTVTIVINRPTIILE